MSCLFHCRRNYGKMLTNENDAALYGPPCWLCLLAHSNAVHHSPHAALATVTCRTCKAAVGAPKPRWTPHPAADWLLPSLPLPSETCNCLSAMAVWCHRCFPLHYSCNGVNLAPHWAISVQPYPMKDTLAPHPPSLHISSLFHILLPSVFFSPQTLSSFISSMPTFTFCFLRFSSSVFPISHRTTFSLVQ